MNLHLICCTAAMSAIWDCFYIIYVYLSLICVIHTHSLRRHITLRHQSSYPCGKGTAAGSCCFRASSSSTGAVRGLMVAILQGDTIASQEYTTRVSYGFFKLGFCRLGYWHWNATKWEQQLLPKPRRPHSIDAAMAYSKVRLHLVM